MIPTANDGGGMHMLMDPERYMPGEAAVAEIQAPIDAYNHARPAVYDSCRKQALVVSPSLAPLEPWSASAPSSSKLVQYQDAENDDLIAGRNDGMDLKDLWRTGRSLGMSSGNRQLDESHQFYSDDRTAARPVIGVLKFWHADLQKSAINGELLEVVRLRMKRSARCACPPVFFVFSSVAGRIGASYY